MTQRRNKKKTLISSIISLILCVSMLLGTTMAWFTDTVSNTGNRIMTGEIGVALLKYEGTDYTDISDGQGDIFATQGEASERLNGILWEPGKTEVVLLSVANTGNLALNYNIVLEIANEGNEALEEVLSYAIIPNVAGKAIEGKANVLLYSDLAIDSWQDIASLQGIETGKVQAGSIKAAPNGALTAGDSDYFALAVHMDENADNRYQNQSIVIDVKVEAKQMPSEYDSFGNQYDADAEYGYDDAITYHVSTTGSDENPGTEEAPFATLAKANEVVSALDKEGQDVQVLIHGGTYFMSEDIVFSGAAAGGSGNNKVIYRAAGDGEVVFSGFLEITGNKLASAKNSKVASMMSEEAKENVVSISLGSYGVKYQDMAFARDDTGTHIDKNNTASVSYMPTYFTLLLNGKEQMMAQWPNYGESEVIEEVVSAGGTTRNSAGAVIKYSDSNIDSWGICPADESRNYKSFSDAIIRGYLSANYREEYNMLNANASTIDTENQTIQLRYYSFAGVKAGRDWRILNLPEELDVPGEFCVDWNVASLALYYYPPYELTKDDVLSLSVAKGVSFICEDTSNIVFDGIKFTGIRNADRSQGVITIQDSENIEVRNCTFTYNDGSGNIVINGKNNIVEACGFYNCGASGVVLLGGGDYNTLEPQNNQILNNHFYNTGTSCNETQAGAVSAGTKGYTERETVGNIIRNNLIHHIYGAMNIMFNGVEYDISYNEVSNGLRDLADYGMIYTGARPIVQGTTINYNYIHDFGSLKNDSVATNGIYIDDWASGQTANNNIIVSNNTSDVALTYGIFSVGAYQNLKYNIMANSSEGVHQGSRTTLVGGSNSTLNNYKGKILGYSDVWQEKYSHMLTLAEAIEDGKVFPTMNNVITDNITYNAPNGINQYAYDLNGTINNNLNVTDATGVFVDPANHDWRITSAYAAANNLNENIITEANFSMDQIGIQKDVWAITNPKESFKLVAPVTGSQTVQPNDVTLNWEQALFADKYEYVVATDPELKNVVASGTTAYEHVNVGDLITGETYYWKITAVNTTRQLAASWECEEVFTFTVDSEKADKSKLVRAIAAATEAFATVEDGTEGTVGDYMTGTKAKLDALLTEGNTINAKEDATQDEVDTITEQLTAATNGLDAYKYKGYVTIDLSDAEKWKSTKDGTTFAIEEGVMTVTGANVVTYTENIPNYNMLTFDVKADLSDGKMLGFMIRSTDQTANQVYSGRSYFFWITNAKIELQIDPAVVAQQTVVRLDYADTADHPMYTTEWQNIRIEAIDKEGGAVEIVLYADNEEIIRYTDETYMLHETGTFAVQRQGTNGVQLRAVSSLPTYQN